MTTTHPELRRTRLDRTPVGFRIGFWACMMIGVAVVARRLAALQQASDRSGAPTELARLDAWFLAHVWMTYLHILTALIFLCTLPFVFWERTARSALWRSAFYCLGAAVIVTAYGMSTYSVGGWVERSAVLVFNTLFAIELWMSFQAWRAKKDAEARQWTLRSTATVLGIATTRPVMGIFFATSRATHWTPQQFFGPAFWIGFSINVLVMEIWLRRYATFRDGSSM